MTVKLNRDFDCVQILASDSPNYTSAKEDSDENITEVE